MTQTKDQQGPSPKGEPAAQLRCYTHPAHRATGVCTICKRGVCSSCQVISKGRRFCRDDADMLRKKQVDTVKAQRRKNAISAGAILAFLDGTAGAAVGFLLVVIGLVGPEAQTSYSLTDTLQPFFTYFANVLAFPPSQAMEVGLFIFGLASLVYPPLKVIVASVTTSVALMLGGVALIVLPTMVVGN